MSYTCGQHGWRHGQSACPQCPTDERRREAEAWAKKCIHERGDPPHWHDVRDAYLAGAASRDAEVARLAAEADLYRRVCDTLTAEVERLQRKWKSAENAVFCASQEGVSGPCQTCWKHLVEAVGPIPSALAGGGK